VAGFRVRGVESWVLQQENS